MIQTVIDLQKAQVVHWTILALIPIPMMSHLKEASRVVVVVIVAAQIRNQGKGARFASLVVVVVMCARRHREGGESLASIKIKKC